MPFDDLKTLPEGFATTPTMQPVAWAVSDRDDGELWCVTLDRDEAFFASGGNAFALIPLYTLGVRPSGVAAVAEPKTPVLPSEFNAAADVARAADQRHDAATCCGEGQEPPKPVEIDGDRPDVEDGWRWLEIGEVMASGDEVAMCSVKGQVIHWVTVYEESLARGNTVTPHLYRFCRRRVTPETKAPQPDAGEGWRWLEPGEVLQERDEDMRFYPAEAVAGLVGWRIGHGGARCYRRRVTPSKPVEIDGNNPDVGEGWRELEDKEFRFNGDDDPVQRLRWVLAAEKAVREQRDALKDEVSLLRSEVKSVRALTDAMRTDNVRLRSEVERLRVTLPAVACEATKRAIDEIIQLGGGE